MSMAVPVPDLPVRAVDEKLKPFSLGRSAGGFRRLGLRRVMGGVPFGTFAPHSPTVCVWYDVDIRSRHFQEPAFRFDYGVRMRTNDSCFLILRFNIFYNDFFGCSLLMFECH